MKIPINLPLDRSGYCELDNSYHIGTIGDINCTGMLIDNEHSIKDLILDVWSNEDTEDNREMADYVLNAINNFPKSVEILKYVYDGLDYLSQSKIEEFLKLIEK